MKPTVSFDDFSKIDLRVGLILGCIRKEGSDKLLRLTVDFGKEGIRNILSGIYPYYRPEDIQGKQFIFIINLEPRKIMREESQGMLLCADGDKPIPLKPKTKAEAGSVIT